MPEHKIHISSAHPKRQAFSTKARTREKYDLTMDKVEISPSCSLAVHPCRGKAGFTFALE